MLYAWGLFRDIGFVILFIKIWGIIQIKWDIMHIGIENIDFKFRWNHAYRDFSNILPEG